MENQPTTLDRAVKVSIIVGALIVALSVAYYLVIFMPQKERAKIEQQKQDQRATIEKERVVKEQQQKEYVAKRKSDCLQVYKTEDAKWNNVSSYEYVEKMDRCYVLYKNQERQKSKEECNKISENMLKIDMVDKDTIANLEWIDCMNNVSRRPF